MPLFPRRRVAGSIAALGLAGLLAAPASASIFASYNAALHERFSSGITPNPTFLLSGHNISGVAYDTTVGTIDAQGAVLITPQHFITANHFRPGSVNFVDTTGTSRSYTGITYFPVTTTYDDGNGNMVTQDSDLVIGRLSTPIPSSHNITPLPIAAGNHSAFAGHELYAFGQNNQAGRNIIDGIVLVIAEDVNGNPVLPTYTTAYDFDTPQNGGTGGVGGDEIGVVAGDSGYTTVMLIDGQLAVLGAHFAIDTENPALDVYYSSYSSFAGAYLDQIQTIVSNDGQSFSTLTVPEPSGALLLLLAGGAALVRRSRRSRAA